MRRFDELGRERGRESRVTDEMLDALVDAVTRASGGQAIDNRPAHPSSDGTNRFGERSSRNDLGSSN